ncbi:WD40 repeat-like protein [Mycena pura]|uniref:WD40 repeat-like protein n=1 Tax=Mycena pura TaxID=153505 RepID=A0AAD6UPI6_9AGAR|nr:WD40 repeat-like protein [Mycena pura]
MSETVPPSLFDETNEDRKMIDGIGKDLEKLTTNPTSFRVMDVVDTGEDIAAAHSDLGAALWDIISVLGPIVEIGDEIAKIHPYVHAAWTILTSVYQAVKKQKETDEELVKLVKAMVKLYSSAGNTKVLPQKIKSLESTVTEIAKQTLECAMFIREYTGHGFPGRLFRSTFSTVTQKKIGDLSEALLELKDSFDRDLLINSVYLSAEMHEDIMKLTDSAEVRKNIRSMMQSDTLGKLYIRFDATERQQCLAGTRRDILLAIIERLTTTSDPSSVLWLRGVAGSGKSTISTTISTYFRDLKRLGAFIFFNRNNPGNSHPKAVVHRMAYGMAESNIQFRKALYDVLAADPTILDATLSEQFEKLLLQPLRKTQSYICGPIIIILDALDECSDETSLTLLVDLIANKFPQLPAVFRFFITSRPISDISSRFENKGHITALPLDITADQTKEDILLYLSERMQEVQQIKKLEITWPGKANIQKLVDSSGGLFIWASTAYKFIQGGFDPQKKLATLLALPFNMGSNLDQLYTIVLESSADWADPEFIEVAPSVLGAIILARMPLSDKTLDVLLGLGAGVSARVLERLGCVIQWRQGQPAITLHASFGDYVTDPKRSTGHPWHIDSKMQNQSLALGCLRVLRDKLQFNICGLKNSHLLNSEVSDLPERIERCIMPELFYASQFWAHHLSDREPDNQVLSALNMFMLGSFLYWLEVLSLLKRLNIAYETLGIALKYGGLKNSDFNVFLQDAQRFINGFAPVIVQSVPHIYISALAFAPKESTIRNHYASRFPRILVYDGPSNMNWSSLQKAIQGHTDKVESVAFSPDGTKIVSGSLDGTVRIWDSHTGAALGAPLEGHTDFVRSVAFSPDGMQIVSGSDDRTVRIWDSQTGAALAAPLEGHTESVQSVAFSPDGMRLLSVSPEGTVQIWDSQTGAALGASSLEGLTSWFESVAFSPDGMQIVSGSGDSGSGDATVQIWDSHTGAALGAPLKGHTNAVISVAFSPDGMRIVSGSYDFNVQIWDSETGAALGAPLEGHTMPVESVAFSPDGLWIVSGSMDYTVRIWDSQTGAALGAPLEGHTDTVRSVAFSPDGMQIVSGSHDGTVRIWDFQTAALAAPLEGHTGIVASVAFSPDGMQIVSGSHDTTVRIWDSQTGAALGAPLEGHTAAVRSVAFSPDGTQIVSGSRDHTVRIWDSQTGAALGAPLQVHTYWVQSVAFSPDGLRLVSGSSDGTVQIWDSQTGAALGAPLKAHTFSVDSVAISPDGMRIVSGSSDSTMRIWDSQTGAALGAPLEGHTSWVQSVAFSPDGLRLVSVSNDKTMRIWDSQTGAALGAPLEGHTHYAVSVAFSPDGLWLVTGSTDNTIRVWDSQTGAAIGAPLEGHTATVKSVAFSPDGMRIVSGSHDHTVRIWDSQTGAAPTNWVQSVAFSPDGMQIVCTWDWYKQFVGPLFIFANLI